MIYFDNASTTKMDPKVIETMNKAFEDSFANPSSLHSLGFKVEKELRKARASIAKKLNIKDSNLFFVPSGTIANNAVINSVKKDAKNIIVSELEHSSIQSLVDASDNIEFRYVKSDQNGFIDEQDLLAKLDDDTVLVSIMHVQNEIGSINDINKLAKLCKDKNPKLQFHSDGVQAFKKVQIDLTNIDYYTISSHKINGPKGIAALYIREPKNFRPLYVGGGQESGLFSSTENTYAIMGFEEAALLETRHEEILKLNQYLRNELEGIDGIKIISPKDNVSPYILNVCIEGIGAEILLHYLEMESIYISTGSACSKGKESKVLKAIGLSSEDIKGCIRISFDRNSNLEEAKEFIKELKVKIDMIRGMIRK